MTPGYATRVPRRSWNIKTFEVLLSKQSRDMVSLSKQSRDMVSLSKQSRDFLESTN